MNWLLVTNVIETVQTLVVEFFLIPWKQSTMNTLRCACMQLIIGINNFTLQIEYLFLHLNTLHTKASCKNLVFTSYKVNENTSSVNLYFAILTMKVCSFRGHSKTDGSDGLCRAGLGVKWRRPDEFSWTKKVTRRKQCKFCHSIKLLLPYMFYCAFFCEWCIQSIVL